MEMKMPEEKWNRICKPIPTYALCDGIGLDTETSYILNLETEVYLAVVRIQKNISERKSSLNFYAMVEMNGGFAIMELLKNIFITQK